jgi:hypothetical protein
MILDQLLLVFWSLMIFLSIGWYGFLLFYIGFKGGREIIELTRTLGAETPPAGKPPGDKP